MDALHVSEFLRYPVVFSERYIKKTEDLPHELRNVAIIYIALCLILKTLSRTRPERSLVFSPL